jgi:hypothetical protein
MATDLETMREELRDVLSDADDETWSAGEKDQLLQWAVRRLNQRNPRPLDPEVSTQQITLVSEDYYYAVDPVITHVNQVFWVDSDGNERGYLKPGSWEVVGDMMLGTAKLHVSPDIVEYGGTLRITGYGRYELVGLSSSQATAIPDDYIQLVLDLAAARAYRRMLSDRARFRQWQNANQTQNMSINELIEMVNATEQAAQLELSQLKRFQRPVPARI